MPRFSAGIALPEVSATTNPPAGHAMLYPNALGQWTSREADGSTRLLATGHEYNARDYGAKGDGVADDTAEIQAALDACYNGGGGVVVIPPGDYLVSTFLVARSDTTIWAYGAYLKATGNTGLLRSFLSTDSFATYSGHARIAVLGGIWDGNAGSGAGGTTTATTNVMGFIHGRHITVRDVTIRNVSSAHAIELNAIDGGQVVNCRFEGYRDNSGDSSRQFSEAVQIDVTASAGTSSIPLYDSTPSKNILVTGCYMGPAIDGTGHGSFGKLCGSHTAPSGVMYTGVRVIGNMCDGALDIGIGGYSWRRCVIANNVVYNPVSHGIVCDTDSDAIGEIAIIGNLVTGSGGSGILVDGTASGTLVTSSRVVGNVITGAGAPSISMQYCAQPGVVGNSIKDGDSTGIFFQNGIGGQMVGNTVLSSGSNCFNSTSQDDVLISGNYGKGPAANYLVNIQSAINCLICGNYFTDPVSNLAIINFTTATQKNLAVGNTMRKGSTGSAYVVRSNSTNGLINYLINNDAKEFSDSATYFGTSGQTNGFQWNTGSSGTPKGTVTTTWPSTTNAGANLIG